MIRYITFQMFVVCIIFNPKKVSKKIGNDNENKKTMGKSRIDPFEISLLFVRTEIVCVSSAKLSESLICMTRGSFTHVWPLRSSQMSS